MTRIVKVIPKSLPGEGLTVVGECDPRGGEPLDRLQPGRSGSRLVKILGISDEEYDRAVRVNLCRVEWDQAAAQAESVRLMATVRGVVVLLGGRVSRAVLGHASPFQLQAVAADSGGWVFVTLPHPSGLCRAWNDRRNFTRARRLLARARRVAACLSRG